MREDVRTESKGREFNLLVTTDTWTLPLRVQTWHGLGQGNSDSVVTIREEDVIQ